jgi:hypothetical protein
MVFCLLIRSEEVLGRTEVDQRAQTGLRLESRLRDLRAGFEGQEVKN